MWDNLQKQLSFILPTSVAQGVSIAVAIILGMPPPLEAIQVLWINMVTAITLGLVLALETPEPSIMTRRPRRLGKRLVGTVITWRTLFVGFSMIIAMLFNAEMSRRAAPAGEEKYVTDHRASTVAMNTLVFSQAMFCVSCRFVSAPSLTPAAWFGNPLLTGMVLLNVALQCMVTYVPALHPIFYTEAVNPIDWAYIMGLATAVFLLAEAEKVLGPRYIRPFITPYARSVSRGFGELARSLTPSFAVPKSADSFKKRYSGGVSFTSAATSGSL